MKIKIIIPALFFVSCAVFADDPQIIPDATIKANVQAVKKHSGFSTGTTTQVSGDELAVSPAATLSDYFQKQQSIVRLTNNSGNTNQSPLSIRGFGDNAAANSLILVDGFPLTNPSLLAPNFNSIPLNDIERVEIFQGSAGTLWGDQAVGGVVNIVTRHPKKYTANSIVSLGSYSRNFYNFFIDDKRDNGLFAKVFALAGQTQNFREHNRELDHNFMTTFGWDYAIGSTTINIQSYSTNANAAGGLTLQQFNQHPQQATNFTNYSYYRTTLGQVLNQQTITGDWLMESRLSRQHTVGNGFVFLNFDQQENTTYWSERFKGERGNHKIISGFSLQQSDYQLSNAKVSVNAKAQQYEVFAQDTYPIWQNIDLIAGTRTAWQKGDVSSHANQANATNNHVFVTEEGVVYHYSPALTCYLRRDGNFSFPKANEQTWLPVNTTSLNVQTGVSYEGGLQYTTDEQMAQLSLYRLVLHNEIAFNPTQTETQPFGAYNNLDQTRRYGITLTELYHITSKNILNAQFNYVDARFAAGPFKNNYIPAVPAYNANVGLTTSWDENWQTQYNVLYTGTRYASEDVANKGTRLPAYWLSNASVQYLYKEWLFGFEVDNIFNKIYPSYAYVNPNMNANIYYPATGRSFLLTVKLNIV